MEDRTDRQIALQGAERFFDLSELQVVVPQLHRIGLGQIGTQQVAAFAATHLLELLAIEAVGERGTGFLDLHRDESPRRWDFALGTAEPHQRRIERSFAIRSRLSANTYSSPSSGRSLTFTPARAVCQGLVTRDCSSRLRRPFGVPTRYCTGGSLRRISARTSSVGTPR